MVVGRIPRGTFSGNMNTRTQRIDTHLLAHGRWLLLAWGFLFCRASVGWCAEAEPAKSGVAPRAALPARLAAYLDEPRFSAAAWGVKVVSLETGKMLFEHQSHKLMKPASNAKLYTGALALDRLGPDFRIKTSLYAAARPDANGILKSDLIIFGRGDPSFAARFNNGDYEKSLSPLVEALAGAGVKRIDGDLVGDETYFRGARFGAGWTWDDLQYYYGAEVSALTVEDNVIDLVFKPALSQDAPCQIIAKPGSDFVSFINRTKTSARGSPHSIEIFRPLGQNTAYVTGHLPLDASNHTGAVAVHEPARFFLSRYREALAKRGILVSGNPRTVGWLDAEASKIDLSEWVELASAESRPLREILAKMLKPSQNLYAQLLLLQVGAAFEPGSRRSGESGKASEPLTRRLSEASPPPFAVQKTTEVLGIAEMKKFLAHAGVPASEVLLDEGSGLSRSCLVTPHATVELLRFMHRHRDAAVFRDCLPVAGVDGSLRNRMKNTKAVSNLRAKTGHIRYVDSLSGYVTSGAGESLAFSIMLNNYSNPARSGREEVDALAVMLSE